MPQPHKRQRQRQLYDYELWLNTPERMYRYNTDAHTLKEAKADARLGFGPYQLHSWCKTPTA